MSTQATDSITFTRDEFLRLLDADDRYGLMLTIVRYWLRKYHPDIDRAAVYYYRGTDLLSMRIPVTTSDGDPVDV